MIDNLTQSIQEAIEYKDQPLALEALTYIKKHNVRDVSEDLVHELGYIRLSSLSLLGATTLFKETILAAYQIPDYVLSDEVVKYTKQIELVPDIVEFADRLESSLASSKELLGQEQIGRLLSEYAGLPNNPRDAFSQTKFLNSSPRTKSLSKDDRAILTDLLKIFDYCGNVLEYWHLLEQMPREEILKQVNPATDWKNLLPGIIESDVSSIMSDTIDSANQPKIVITPPVIPSRPTTPQAPAPLPQTPPPKPTVEQRRILEDITRSQNKAVTYGDKTHVPNTSADSAQIHDLINHKPSAPTKRGVTMDPTNIKIGEEGQRMTQDRDKQMADIQKKLAELRSRNNKTE